MQEVAQMKHNSRIQAEGKGNQPLWGHYVKLQGRRESHQLRGMQRKHYILKVSLVSNDNRQYLISFVTITYRNFSLNLQRLDSFPIEGEKKKRNISKITKQIEPTKRNEN